eukprot:NODE_482_length_2047_cov_14.357357_g382_i0.p1 GENE.NODE_482_length_2047_cov_14.357357_g382_i0~~NODE_482_length_2047_cov_14.357357_g382_i0.p1  ORF type:complete len:437 (-),score=156.64 NODE_482_length_2047_cov_14.357357_g382_i0:737-2023(-)
MEYYSAQWDGRLERFIAGAQDNYVQLSMPKAKPTDPAIAVDGGDGTNTAVDNVHCPARLYGCIQFLDNMVVVQGSGKDFESEHIPIERWFGDQRNVPYFQQPFVLNSQAPEKFTFFINGTDGTPDAIWQITIPENLKDVGAQTPKMLYSLPEDVYDYVLGGWTEGKSDPSVFVGMNDHSLFYASSATDAKVVARRLPSRFAKPVDFHSYFDNYTQSILGPLSHAKTVSVGVLDSDSKVIALTGWPHDQLNTGDEYIWLTTDAGSKWIDITGNIAVATGTSAKARPSGIRFIEFSERKTAAIVVGTVSGVYVAWLHEILDGSVEWYRLGTCKDFPLVIAKDIRYEPYADVLVIATLGRGVWTLRDAKANLLKSWEAARSGVCRSTTSFNPKSSLKYFPKPATCGSTTPDRAAVEASLGKLKKTLKEDDH